MTGLEIAAAAALVVFVAFMIFAVATMNRSLRQLQASIEELRRESVPLVTSMRSTVAQATTELERVDDLLATAESVSHTVDAATRLAYLAFSNPVIKVLAFGSGAARATRHLRRSRA
jgi:uncharacterized protein YoxC